MKFIVTTAPDGLFSATDLDNFSRDGYVVVRGLTGSEFVGRMRAVTDDGLRRLIGPIEYEADVKYPGSPESLDARGGRTVRRLKQAFTRDYVFLEWVTQPAILGRLQQLLGPKVVSPLAHHNCIMTKHPDFSSETGWHQDIRYWAFQRPELVNAWIALGPETQDNGCLQVIPGSHHLKYQPEQFDQATFLRPDLPVNQPLIATKQFVTLQPGDVLFFHCLTFHAATRNFSRETKYSAVFTFRPLDNPPKPGTRSADYPELLLTPG